MNHRRWSGLVLLAIALGSLEPRAVSPSIVISQVYGGGGNAGATLTNDFIELYNRGDVPITVTGWTVQYASSAGTTWQTTALTGTIPPGRYYLVQEAAGSGGTQSLPTPDASGGIAMAAGAGKVALVTNGTALTGACPTGAQILDFVGYGTAANCFEGAGPTATLLNTTAAIRHGAGEIDTDNNNTDLATGTPTPRNSGTVSGALAADGAANPSAVSNGDASLLTVTVTPGTDPASTGITVTANLTLVGGAAAQAFFDDGSNGDTTAGDNIFSWLVTSVTGAPGVLTLPVSVADAQGRSAPTTIQIAILAPPANVLISQVYGGGGNAGADFRNDFIELRNRESFDVSVSGWSVQYTSAAGTTWQSTPLSGTIPAGGFYLVQEAAGAGGTLSLPTPDATGTIAMSASSGKVALVAGTTLLTGSCPLASTLDFVGYGSANCAEGGAPAPTLANATAARRLNDGLTDTNNNAADFVSGAPNPRSSIGTPPTGIGRATPASVADGGTTLLTVSVTSGAFPPSPITQVIADLTALGGASQPLFDDGTNGDVTAHDLTFSVAVVVSGAPGIRVIPAAIHDARGRTGAASIRVAVETPPVAIAAIQGSGSTSPLAGQFVTTAGVVTALRNNGFFVQTADGADDGDPATSDGLFVFTGSLGALAPAVGDALRVSGLVTEFGPAPPNPPITELSGGPVWVQTQSGQTLPAAAILVPSDTVPSGGNEQLERYEGMRVGGNFMVVAPTDGFTNEAQASSTSNGDFFVVIDGVVRPMREPGLDPGDPVPAGLPCCVPRFDGNPERLRVDSDGQLGAPRLELAAGQRLLALTGVLDFTFGVYQILPDPGAGTIDGAQAAIPVPVPNAGEFTIASFNVERLFDEFDDPDTDDPVIDADAVQRRLQKASLAIRTVLRLPDILGIVEAENLPILQRLADRLNADEVAAGHPSPMYVAYLEEGNDIGGIDVGLLVKSARVQVVSVEQVGKDATYLPPGSTVPATRNDRPPLVLKGAIQGPLGPAFPMTVIVNHLRSLRGVAEDDGPRVRAKRRAQAEFLADLIQSRQATERIVSVGDYNAFQFNDGLVDVIGTIKGQPTPADQVALASLDLVTPDLTGLGDTLPSSERYSFVFDGNAQTLDHALVNDGALRRFSRVAFARSNADFPESLRGDATRPERLSDHDAIVAYFTFPGAPVVTLNGANPLDVEAFTTFEDPGATAHDEDGPLPVTVTGLVDPNTPGDYSLTYTATNGFLTSSVTRLVRVRDTIAPTIDGLTLNPQILFPPNRRLVDVSVDYVAADASGATTCGLSVTSNDTSGPQADWIVVDPHHVRLRAEWAGLIGTRIYTVTTTCTDPSGNASTDRARAFVPGLLVILLSLL